MPKTPVKLGEWSTPWGRPILELQGDSHWSSPEWKPLKRYLKVQVIRKVPKGPRYLKSGTDRQTDRHTQIHTHTHTQTHQ